MTFARPGLVPSVPALGVLAALTLASPALAQPVVTLLQPPPGRDTLRASGLSGDGRVAVGVSSAIGNFSDRLATLVRPGVGASTLPLPAGATSASAWAASFDASFVLGTATFLFAPGNAEQRAVRWTPTGIDTIPAPAGLDTSTSIVTTTSAISDDGTVVAGLARDGFDQRRAFVWTPTTGTVSIPSAGPIWNPAVSRNGAFAVGVTDGPPIAGIGASGGWRWSAATGTVETLPSAPAGYRIRPDAVAGDGTVLGIAVSDTSSEPSIFSWNPGTGYVFSPVPAGVTNFGITGISSDARTIAATVLSGFNPRGGFIRMPDGSFKLVDSLLIEAGLAPNSFFFTSATALSADGSTIIGEFVRSSGGSQAFVLVIPAPTACVPLVLAAAVLAQRRR
jgi:probable HAF family extracellular repeat protein